MGCRSFLVSAKQERNLSYLFLWYTFLFHFLLLLYSHLHHHSASQRRKTSLTTYLPLTLLQGFERVVQGLHVRWRPNINFIFWPHCYDHHVVSFLFSWCWGRLHRGFEDPLGRVWPSLPHLVSNSLEFYWQLLWHPNSTQLYNNSTPTRSPTGSLKSNV